jgi:hypothetical protein
MKNSADFTQKSRTTTVKDPDTLISVYQSTTQRDLPVARTTIGSQNITPIHMDSNTHTHSLQQKILLPEGWRRDGVPTSGNCGHYFIEDFEQQPPKDHLDSTGM